MLLILLTFSSFIFLDILDFRNFLPPRGNIKKGSLVFIYGKYFMVCNILLLKISKIIDNFTQAKACKTTFFFNLNNQLGIFRIYNADSPIYIPSSTPTHL